MDAKITIIYCIIDDILKAINQEDKQRRMSDSEVITTAVVAMLFFRGNLESARQLLKAPSYIHAKF